MNLEPLHYIDLHSHHRRQAEEGCRIISFDTRDFDPALIPGYSFSLGLHPWYLTQQDCEEGLRKISAALGDDNMLAVGECGLDNLAAAPLKLQELLFREQLRLAERAGKPVIIHCVRMFNELLRIKKTERMATPWIIHGFNAKLQIAEQVLARGCYLSFGKALLQEGSNASKALSMVPLDRCFLETDEAEGALSDIYRSAARIRQLDLEALKAQIVTNFYRVFMHD